MGNIREKFHEYFYSGESEIRLSHLVAIKQKYNESMFDYMRRFRDTRNKCYGLTIRDKDLAELAFADLSMALRDKMEGQEFSDVNQVLQRAMVCKNLAKEQKTHGRFRNASVKDKLSVNWVDDGASSEEDTEVCITEWVDMAPGKPLAYSFPRPSLGKKEEVKFTFNVTKCDKLFDVLLQNKVIRLSKGHVVPPLG
jgi:hypothetical protein